MPQIRYFVFVLALIAPRWLTATAQDEPATTRKPSTSLAEPAPVGGVATAVTGEFNWARPPEPQRFERSQETFIPRSKRWKVHWTPTDLPEYMRQLDYFGIELAATGDGKPLLEYVSKVSQPRPEVRKGAGKAEPRMCMTWNGKGGKLVDFDKAILARAGVATNRKVLQFFPAVVEDQLAFIEKDHAERQGHNRLQEYRQTIFGVRAKGKGYELYVEDQQFREAPR